MNRLTFLLGAAATATLAGCAGAGSVNGTGGSQEAPNYSHPAVPASAGGAGGGAAPAPAQAQASDIVVGTPAPDIERSVTAHYLVPPDSFLQSFEAVASDAVALGGYVAASQTWPDSKGRIVKGSLTVKVPVAKLSSFIDGFPGGFTPESINFGTTDHTAQFIDVRARLGSAQAHLTALQHLLSRARSLDDITSLEQQIEAVQAEIDTDQGQLNLLNSKVVYATATVGLQERGATAAPPAPISNGVSTGLGNAVSVTSAIFEGVLTVLPILVLGALAGAVWWWFRRHTRRTQAPQSA